MNVGELVGPFLEVRVGGDLSEDDPSDLVAPKRFKADITGGALCLSVGGGDGVTSAANIARGCVPLPIKGEGVFYGVYLGPRLRIGQNLNGGGVRQLVHPRTRHHAPALLLPMQVQDAR